jgi:hypothetical protein
LFLGENIIQERKACNEEEDADDRIGPVHAPMLQLYYRLVCRHTRPLFFIFIFATP